MDKPRTDGVAMTGAGSVPRRRGCRCRAVAGLALLVAALLVWPAPASARDLSESDLVLYRDAFRSVQREQWGDAVATAARAHERLPAKIIRWMDLARPRSGHSFAEISAFIRSNPAWPNHNGLARQAEETMPATMPAAEVVAWFEAHAPVSALGVGRYADALVARGDSDKAAALVKRFWLEANFTAAEDEVAFRHRFAAVLQPADHLARLERVLWDHQALAAQRLLPLVDEGQRALALARLALAGDEPGLDETLRRVPPQLAGDPGLAYERLHWRRAKENYAGALEILNHPPAELGRPALWWTERNFFVRLLLKQRNPSAAYLLVTAHGLSAGQPLAEAEFLAGWLALRHLHLPAEALGHFQRLYEAVTAPMSRARGAYWCGRAADALDDHEQAQDWYRKAAAFPTMFYGQMATLALGREIAPAMPAEPVPGAEAALRFARRDLVQAARLLHEIDPGDSAGRVGLFLRRMARDVTDAADWPLLGRLAIELNRPDEAIFVAKQAFQAGVVLTGSGYPEVSLRSNVGIEGALALALIRQESTFNNKIVSSAGARGLMQLMPNTSKRLAHKLSLKHDPTDARLSEDNDYNILIGTAEIQELLESYHGSYILTIAGYNAGSGRIDDWLGIYGDPRKPGVDPLDWIESIPFAETRNYVQRVLEAAQVYRWRRGAGGRSLKQDLGLK